MNYEMFGLTPLQETRNGPMSGKLRMDVGSFMSCDTKKAKEHGFGVSEWTAPFSPRPVFLVDSLDPCERRAGNRFFEASKPGLLGPDTRLPTPEQERKSCSQSGIKKTPLCLAFKALK